MNRTILIIYYNIELGYNDDKKIVFSVFRKYSLEPDFVRVI